MFSSGTLANCFVFGIAVVSLCKTVADDAFTYIQSDINIYSRSVKVWHRYVRKLLTEHLSESRDHPKYCFGFLLKVSSSFEIVKYRIENLEKEYSQRLLNDTDFLLRHCRNCKLAGTSEELGRRTIARASGTFQIFKKSQLVCFKDKCIPLRKVEAPHCQVDLQFILDRDIVLNFTFYEIYFSTGPVPCKHGRMRVHNLFLSSIFCAHHALLNLYPPGNHVELSLFIEPFSIFNITATFSVIDKHIVHSTNHHKAFEQIVAYKFRNEAVLYSFTICTRKSHHIILALLLHHKYIIYDGPGLFSTSVKTLHRGWSCQRFSALSQCFHKWLYCLGISHLNLLGFPHNWSRLFLHMSQATVKKFLCQYILVRVHSVLF